MAKVFGKPGGYVQNTSSRNFCKMIMWFLGGTGLFCYVFGLLNGLIIGKNKYACLFSLVFIIPAAVGFLLRKQINSRFDKLTEDIISYRKGAEGEYLTAEALVNLPDSYAVLHDVTHPSINGNIDHVVVGPTGVFALETKDWHGMVSLSGNSKLMLNDKYDKSKHGKVILGRSVDMNKKIEALSGVKTFVQAVMVFPHASVKVLPGTKSALNVQQLNYLENLIKKPAPSRALTSKQVDTITTDLKALFKL